MRLSAILAWLFFAFPAVGEPFNSTPIPIAGGIICDTPEDVVRYIETGSASTCGRLVIPTPAIVTPTEQHEHDGKLYQLVEYTLYLPTGEWIQYGWWANPVAIGPPKPQGTSL